MRAIIKGILTNAKRGEFTPEGKDVPVEYWRVVLQGADGYSVSFGFDFTLGEQIFGNQGSLDAIVNKAVDMTVEISQYERVIRLKGVDVHLSK